MPAGYLHDHRIQGQVLMPGAAMFELSGASARCLGGEEARAVIQGISLSAPLIISDANTAAKKLLTCTVKCETGRLEVWSLLSASQPVTASRFHGQLHLGGWAHQTLAPARLSSRTDAGSQVPRTVIKLLPQLLQVAHTFQMPTSVACLRPIPYNTCKQPDGHAIHPATLDAATHTAAAFAPARGNGQTEGIGIVHLLKAGRCFLDANNMV
jgi:hypothetical protein